MLVLISIIFISVLIILIILYLIFSYKNSTYNEFCKYVLVLGAKILDKDTPCKILENRLKSAIEYLNMFKDSIVIVSGGKGNDEPVSESEVMMKYLIKHNISKKRIIIENSSYNTYQNLKETKELLGNTTEILIVTSGYHLLRSKILAKRVGFKNINLIGSEVSNSRILKNLIREIFAIIKSFFLDW